LHGIADDLGAPSPVPPGCRRAQARRSAGPPSTDHGSTSSTHYDRAQRWHGVWTTMPAHSTDGTPDRPPAAAVVQPPTGKRAAATVRTGARKSPSPERSPPAGTPTHGHPGGSARSYLTLNTLATVLQSWDDHPHHRLTMPIQHGVLSLRWPLSHWPCCWGKRAAARAPVRVRRGRCNAGAERRIGIPTKLVGLTVATAQIDCSGSGLPGLWWLAWRSGISWPGGRIWRQRHPALGRGRPV
jgi:hypothetical protein